MKYTQNKKAVTFHNYYFAKEIPYSLWPFFLSFDHMEMPISLCVNERESGLESYIFISGF
ncbi:MAG: hypothetical protein CVV03_12305 [Firmicutes bacterium HGW-Firmicutes-8]|nr:MAG: hypothetical protein CVV03_12305 [Firmicutes bacterium HGW-Firmicutes-8]